MHAAGGVAGAAGRAIGPRGADKSTLESAADENEPLAVSFMSTAVRGGGAIAVPLQREGGRRRKKAAAAGKGAPACGDDAVRV